MFSTTKAGICNFIILLIACFITSYLEYKFDLSTIKVLITVSVIYFLLFFMALSHIRKLQ